jgi:flagellar biosynthesis GTPase FlhF
MLNNDNNLRPAYAFAYVTEPQDIKEDEEVNLSPTVFKWFWVVATVVSTFAANQVKKSAEKKAKKEMEAASKEAQASQQKYLDEKAIADQQIKAQEAQYADQQKAQQTAQQEADTALAQAKKDQFVAQQTAAQDVAYAKKQSQLSMATADAQTQQQLALSEGTAEVGTPVGQPGVSATTVKQTPGLGIGGTQEPDEGLEAKSGLTI